MATPKAPEPQGFRPIEVTFTPDETFRPIEVDFTPPAPPTPKPAKSATPKES